MQIIPEYDRPGIVLNVVTCPEKLDIADTPAVEVRIENRSGVTLTSTDPYPLNISYFWIYPNGTQHEGLRTRLSAPIRPGAALSCRLTIASPRVAGTLTLRLALVQEHVFWFSDPPSACFVDRIVEVYRDRWWTSPEQAPVFGDIDALNHRKFASRLSFNGGSRPLMLTIETVNSCNFDCVFCPYSSAKRPKTVMPLDLFELALDQYVAIGGGAVSLTPMVGDVFLDRFLRQRFQLIRQRPEITNLSITTNGSLFQLVGDDALAYIMSQLHRLQISLYGVDSEEHNLITRRSLFDRVINNVRRALDVAGDASNIYLGFRLLKERSPEFLEEWVQNAFGRAIPFGWTVEYMNWINAMDTSKRLPLDGRWIQLTGARDQCFLPVLACHVFPNGDVSFCPCDDFDGSPDLHLGNITEKSLAEIYNSARVRQLWKKLPSICSGCTAYQPLTNITIPMFAEAVSDPSAFTGG